MTGHRKKLGSPFVDICRGAEPVAMTSGASGFRHYITTADERVAMPTVFSFRQVDGDWRLTTPSIVDEYARKWRYARGKTTDG